MNLPSIFHRKKSSNHVALKVIGGAVVAAVAAGLVLALRDVRRYIKIRTM